MLNKYVYYVIISRIIKIFFCISFIIICRLSTEVVPFILCSLLVELTVRACAQARARDFRVKASCNSCEHVVNEWTMCNKNVSRHCHTTVGFKVYQNTLFDSFSSYRFDYNYHEFKKKKYWHYVHLCSFVSILSLPCNNLLFIFTLLFNKYRESVYLTTVLLNCYVLSHFRSRCYCLVTSGRRRLKVIVTCWRRWRQIASSWTRIVH